MERRKPRLSADEVALVKSAAWARLEHGSKAIPEFDVWRTRITEPKPPRYKLEAMRKFQETSNSPPKLSASRSANAAICAAKYSLLDEYEVERISRLLDYYKNSSRANYYHGGDAGGWRAGAVAGIKRKSGRKKKATSGFGLRPQGVVCGSSKDAVVDGTSIGCSRRQPEKGRVAVVEAVGCWIR